MTESLLQDAIRLRRAGRFQEAAALYDAILVDDPEHFAALHALGTLRYQTGDIVEAERLIGAAIRVNPGASDALFNRGCLLTRLDRLGEAVDAFTAAVARRPDYFEALNNRGGVYLQLKRDEEALADFDAIAGLRPQFAPAWRNRGVALARLGRFEEARASFERCIALDPRDAEAWIGRGAAALKLGEAESALADFDRALQRAPQDAQIWASRGNALSMLERWGDAIAAYDSALARAPDNADTLYHRGVAAMQLRRFPDAIRDFETVLERDPAEAPARGNLLFCRLSCCDWRDVAALRSELLQALAEGTQAANPLTALLLDDPSQSRADAAGAALEAARLWAARIPAQAAPASNPRRTGTGERIRIAYVSTDFHEHAVARLLAGVLESHDRARFEIVGVALGPARAGAMRERLAKACDRFLVCANESDARIAHGIRAIDADIAIDLNGYTMGSRSGIFARRPAPVQVNYLGFAGSMGAPYYDYLIADPVVVPEKDEALFDEKIVRLPHSYLPYDRGRRITPRPSRTQAGLPETGFVFCAFNNPFKFTPELFSVWMRLLAGAPGSVLWLGAAADAARANLAREAQARGVSGERLVFAPLIAADEDYLARMSLADLFLDTLPYNAHATAMDALWAGVPVLTVKGGTFPGRVAASLLGTAGLSELATDSLDAYEAAGAALARDRDALQAVKAGLRAARDASALFDTPLYTRHLESAYARMWERHLSGAPPQAFAVRAAEGA